MNEPEFYASRKFQIDSKLDSLARMDMKSLKAYFEQEFERHKNKHNPIVNWDNQKLTKQRCSTILGCMGSRTLCMFLEKLATDFKQWSFGMPDLILWREPRNSGTG